MKLRSLAAVTLALSIAVSSIAHANECSSDIQSAMDQSRMTYVNGMNGLASNNFSSRPGTYSNIACLDKFMKGSMDIFFKPPQLTDLLGQVLNFACQQAKQAMSGGGGGSTNLGSLIGSLAGGLSVPGSNGGSQTINLNQVLGAVIGGSGSGSSFGSGSGGRSGSTSSGIQGLFR